ncbi:MAG: transposase [Thermoanaerobacter sp.]|nr:transposase [Thermoanaerobacter sp.]
MAADKGYDYPNIHEYLQEVRKEIERVFGHAKTWHEMARARYRGIKCVALQVFLTFIVTNAKKAALIG